MLGFAPVFGMFKLGRFYAEVRALMLKPVGA